MWNDHDDNVVEAVAPVPQVSRTKGILAWRYISNLYARIRKSGRVADWGTPREDSGQVKHEADRVERAIPVNPAPAEDAKGEVLGSVINTKA